MKTNLPGRNQLPPSQISCLWKQPEIAQKYCTAVSLHSHTNQSKESLLFIPAFAEKRPLLRWALNEQIKKSVRPVDFSQAYWTPPLPPKLAFELESNQIEADLELISLVSLTDHDSIEAPTALRQLPNPVRVPFAVEWSVPFEGAIFHLGIHNLPESQAHLIMDDFAAYSRNPSPARLLELLSSLHSIPDVLIVFNHPHWDQYCLGQATFRNFVDKFLQCHVEYIHAFELNAMRAWTENKSVIELAAAWQRPLISGGDRHGLEPSGALNLTRATSFSDFINEISSAIFFSCRNIRNCLASGSCKLYWIRFAIIPIIPWDRGDGMSACSTWISNLDTIVPCLVCGKRLRPTLDIYFQSFG
jgi:hypothetical protein